MFESDEGVFIYKGNGEFFEGLSERVEKVDVFQFKMKFGDNNCLADFNIKNKSFDIISIERSGRNKLIPYIKVLWFGYKNIHAYNFIYLSYPLNISVIFALLAIFQNKPFGLYVRGEHGIESRISKFLFKRAEISLTVSPQFTDLIKRSGGNAETIRPMIDENETDIVFDRTYEAKDKYKLIYVGRIELAKGSYDLISAISLLVEKGIYNIGLDMIGDGEDAVNIKKQVIDLGLSKYITFHGTITDREILKKFYKDADLFILPTHHEGFPRVLYEAMIAGLPILTTFVGTISYLMKDGVNCYQISLKNPADIASRIANVINDYPEKATVAINGIKTIRSYLSDKKETHEEHLIRILKEKGIA